LVDLNLRADGNKEDVVTEPYLAVEKYSNNIKILKATPLNKEGDK